MLTPEEIQKRFVCHAPSPHGSERHALLLQHFVTLAEVVEAICPDGREKALVFTKLEEAYPWAVAAISRNPDTPTGGADG